jgi:hypothetical protein
MKKRRTKKTKSATDVTKQFAELLIYQPEREFVVRIRTSRHGQEDGTDIDMPDIWVFGTRNGFKWLGRVLQKFAEHPSSPDSGAHWHLTSGFDDVIDAELSDELEFRFDLLAEDRAAVLRYYSIRPDNRRRGKRVEEDPSERDLGDPAPE